MQGITETKKYQYLIQSFSDLPSAYVLSHLHRLDLDYFNAFDTIEIRSHIETLRALSPKQLFVVRFQKKNNSLYRVAYIGFDYPNLFNVLTGILTVYGFEISSGASFTYSKYDREIIENTEGFISLSKNDTYYLEKQKVFDFFDVKLSADKEWNDKLENQFYSELENFILQISRNQFDKVYEKLTYQIGETLEKKSQNQHQPLFPIQVNIHSDNEYTILKITGQDTPVFLYALSNALALKKISIHKVFLETKNDKVKDVLYVTNANGKTISLKKDIEKLKAAIVIIKQFTMLLPIAASPSQAMRQFDQFLDRLLLEEDYQISLSDLDNPFVLPSLVKVFGSGQYIWEEFMKMQHENLSPVLMPLGRFEDKVDRSFFANLLTSELSQCAHFEEKIQVINQFKDKQLFQIDLLFVQDRNRTFIEFSEALNALAEVTLETMLRVCYEEVSQKYGVPMLKGRPCSYGFFGLGKFGSEELGYASDIEMIFIYEGEGETDAGHSISNSEFFCKVMDIFRERLSVKSKGIFEVDLRLRPHGNHGPVACDFNQWRIYYSPKGEALNYERQSLIRMRAISGEESFLNQVIQLKDQYVYESLEITFDEVLAIRQKQIKHLVDALKINAKFSRGGLVDLEYSIQLLQILNGKMNLQVRETNTLKALDKLLDADIISATDYEGLYNAYAFLRRLINALRMVRGNAKDLEIPDEMSDAFLFLAKRMGYLNKPHERIEEQLALDIERHFKFVTKFFNRQAGLDASKEIVSGPGLADCLLDGLPEDKIEPILKRWHIVDTKKIAKCLVEMMQACDDPKVLVTILVHLERFVTHSPDPDKIILNLQKYLSQLEYQTDVLRKMVFQPKSLDVLVLAFGHSDFLSDLLIREPYLIHYIAYEHTMEVNKSRDYYLSELRANLKSLIEFDEKMESVRRFRNMEILRIGVRDVSSHTTFQRVVREISNLADVILQIVFEEIILDMNLSKDLICQHQCIIAMGKLGGRELNYSSDIDLLFVISNALPSIELKADIEKVNRKFIEVLTQSTVHGKLFRVDMRLRPYGRSGPLVGNLDFYKEYYYQKADGWEIQAWIKARAVVGSEGLGNEIVTSVQKLLIDINYQDKIFNSIDAIRQQVLDKLKGENVLETEVKSGPGGIRAVEFFVQRLQIRHAKTYLDLIGGNTLMALEKLTNYKLVTIEDSHFLQKAYLFLRDIEHRMQLLGMQQLHVLPKDPAELQRLSKRLGYEDGMRGLAREKFIEEYKLVTSALQKFISANP